MRLFPVVAGAVGLLALAAAPALGYGKATRQTALTGTFNGPRGRRGSRSCCTVPVMSLAYHDVASIVSRHVRPAPAGE